MFEGRTFLTDTDTISFRPAQPSNSRPETLLEVELNLTTPRRMIPLGLSNHRFNPSRDGRVDLIADPSTSGLKREFFGTCLRPPLLVLQQHGPFSIHLSPSISTRL
jgi:hypothetical protein